MDKIISVLLLLLSFTVYSQTTPKKEILLDENGKIITANDFKKKVASPKREYTYTRFENDTAVFGKIVLRKEYGTLTKEDRLKVIEELGKLSGRKIYEEQTVIVNFFYKNLTNNTTLAINHYPSDGKYKRFISRNPQYAQFFLAERGLKSEKDYVYEDQNEVIRRMLFPHNFEANYIIIKPDGKYFKHIGEYRQDDIPEILEAEWNVKTK